jgi:glucose/arabinose dehydrogenase
MKKYFVPFGLFIGLCAFWTCKKDPEINTHTPQLKIEVFVKNLQVPWGMAFLPNGDFLFCERNGQINLKKRGEADYNMIMFRSVQPSEGGLLGIAVDPDIENNHYIFIYETVVGQNQVVRLKMENDILTEDAVILSGIPAANNHDGGALRFGPDGYLYLGTGDATNATLAQDTSSLAGKILRLDRNGNAAPGNPFNSRIWTYGHRNVQGFDWNKNGKMIATEHGPTIEFGWCCHDEINLIEPGKNYGWPIAIGGTETDSLTPAIYQTGFEVWAPSGCTFIHGKEWGSWDGDFIFGALKGQRLVRFDISADGTQALNRQDTLIGTFQRLRNVIQAPDGSLLFSSSNVGVSSPPPLAGDDKIYRLYWD